MSIRRWHIAIVLLLLCLGGAVWWVLRDTAGDPVPISWGYTGFSRSPTRPLIALNGELWDIERRQKVRDFGPAWSSVAWSPDGQYVANVTQDGVAIEDIQGQLSTRTVPWVGDTAELQIQSVTWSTDGSLLVVGAREMGYTKTNYHYVTENGILALYRMPAGTLIRHWRVTTDEVHNIAISPDGALVIVPSKCSGEVWSVAEDRRIRELDIGVCIAQPVFSHDGTLLAGTRAEEILIYDTRTWRLRATLRSHTGWVNTLAFSPDDTLLASGAGIRWSSSSEPPTDTTARVWRVADGQLLTVFGGHRAPVKKLSKNSKQVESWKHSAQQYVNMGNLYHALA